jgi:hypothetical protein
LVEIVTIVPPSAIRRKNKRCRRELHPILAAFTEPHGLRTLVSMPLGRRSLITGRGGRAWHRMRRSGRTTTPGQEAQGMPTSHDDLLTPAELEAAQLMATLAWRWMVDNSSAPTDAGQALQHPDQRRRHGEHRAAPTSRAQRRTRDPAATDRNPRSPARMAHRPSGDVWLTWLHPTPRRRPILPMFCPTDLYQAARPRITLNDESAWAAPDQGECNSDEPSRTEPNDSHPAENRKVGGSIPSLPTTTAQANGLAHLAPRGTVLTPRGRQLVPLRGLS